jgi:hypothetical protein
MLGDPDEQGSFWDRKTAVFVRTDAGFKLHFCLSDCAVLQ